MGEAYICRRGGGSSEVAVSSYGVICAVIPAGSSCSCVQGEMRLSVENTTDLVAFAVPDSGLWTVTISDGTRSKSGTVSIFARGEIKTITLDYSETPPKPEVGTKTLLSPESGLASGYAVSGNAVFTGSVIREREGGGFWLSPAVDMSNYTTLTVSGKARVVSYGYSRISVDSSTEGVFNIAETPARFVEWTGMPNADYTVTINVAALNGSFYIGSTSVGNNLEITRIELT